MSLRCLFGVHRYGNPGHLSSLGIWYVQCERCGKMLKVADSRATKNPASTKATKT